jgi:CubicO group peptidase (beta-lactamase class C family)
LRGAPAVLLVLVSALAAGQDPAPSPSAAGLESYLRSCERFGFAGSVLVAKDGSVLLASGFGLANRETGARNTKETLFEIASATKPFTAVAILQLEAAGKLSLDDPIGRHLPAVPPGFEDVTIRHLLTHTSGMPRSAGGGRGEDLANAVRGYLAAQRRRKAGVAYEYWNGGYALLAGIVERASGGTYVEWCRRRIFEPAGMTSSGFEGDSRFDADRIATGYEIDGPPRRANEHAYGTYGWHYRGMGGIVTSVEDLFRFDRALRDDTLLPEIAREKLFTPFLAGYSCGFRVSEKPRRRIGHAGAVRGFYTDFARYPADDACIVVLCNVAGIPTMTIEENLRAILLGDRSRFPRPPSTVTWPAEKLDAVAGDYEAAPGERLVVRREGEGLLLGAQGSDIARELLSLGFGALSAADAALARSAESIVRALAGGDVEPLREAMSSGIPPHWPDRVKAESWPERVAGLGKVTAIRQAGALARGKSTTVLLALAFENGEISVKVGFVGPALQILDLHGPEFLAQAPALPTPDGRLARFSWLGPPPPPIAIVRDAGGRPTGLRFERDRSSVVYRRLKRS